MSSFTFLLPDSTGHAASPRTGTCVRADGSGPADPLNAADYPVVAACKVCGGTVRLEDLRQMEWRHAPAPAAGGAR